MMAITLTAKAVFLTVVVYYLVTTAQAETIPQRIYELKTEVTVSEPIQNSEMMVTPMLSHSMAATTVL